MNIINKAIKSINQIYVMILTYDTNIITGLWFAEMHSINFYAGLLQIINI